MKTLRDIVEYAQAAKEYRVTGLEGNARELWRAVGIIAHELLQKREPFMLPVDPEHDALVDRLVNASIAKTGAHYVDCPQCDGEGCTRITPLTSGECEACDGTGAVPEATP